MDQNNQMAITKMREWVKKLGSSPDKYGDQTLRRFLVVRAMNPEKAAQLLVEWEKWRAEIAPHGYIPDAEVADQLASKKAFLQGPTKDGYPMLIIKGRKHIPTKDTQPLKKFVVCLLDKTLASSTKGRDENKKMVIVLDMQNLGLKNLDGQGLIAVAQYIKSYYPGTLLKMYILGMPHIFVGIWKLLSTFMEKTALQKVMVVKSEKEKIKMIEEIGNEALPDEYGGIAKLTLIQHVKPKLVTIVI